ncbi:hypothetical protein PM082_016819 [Marasmius tenuissimus]|nr:hypothetical protein PM082_016819 [Marasmius tenuissimus]
MFNNSNSFSIGSGGTFSVVYGNQVNYCTHPPQTRHRFRSGEKWKESIYREYERISTGNLRLIGTITETKVDRWDTTLKMICGSDRTVEAKRVTQLACVVIGTQETRPSLSIKYTGRDAKKVTFSQPSVLHQMPADFDLNLTPSSSTSSQIRDPLFPQLRSFNDSDIPMVVFHDDLIPAKQVIEGAQNSIEIRCYLGFQGQIAYSNLAKFETLYPMISDEYEDSDHLWIRPQTGQICLGPAGPSLKRIFSLSGAQSHDNSHAELSPVPLSMYNNLTMTDLTMKNAPSWIILDALSNEYTRTDPAPIADYNYYHYIWSSSCRQPVAKFVGISWYFRLRVLRWFEPRHFEQPEQRLMGDGRIRLTISDLWIRAVWFSFRAEGFRTSRNNAWLSQAAHVFNVLGIPRKEWEGYTLIDINWIDLNLIADINDIQLISHHSRCVDTRFDPPCYLFIVAPPQLPDTTPDVAAWLRAPAKSLYYWSHDPNGDSKIPETQQIALGLPSFHQSFIPNSHVSWKAEVYDLVQQWQEAQGFDPTTTDFARLMGHPILEIFPRDGNRIEDCMEDDEVDSRHEPELERMEVDECFETDPTASQGTLFPQERFGESSSMDIDMEDCSDLMADLRIEATLMDE